MVEPRPEISCPMFLKREWTVKELTRDINSAGAISDKAEIADRLKNQVKMLLACEKYDKTSEDCKNCRIISTLRKQTADLLIKTQSLERFQ